MKQSGVMAVKKKIIINERGRFACQAYIESATALSDRLDVGMIINQPFSFHNFFPCFLIFLYTVFCHPYINFHFF